VGLQEEVEKTPGIFEDSVEMRHRMAGIEEWDHSWIGTGEIVSEMRSIMGKRDLGKAFLIHCYKERGGGGGKGFFGKGFMGGEGGGKERMGGKAGGN